MVGAASVALGAIEKQLGLSGEPDGNGSAPS
jgi:hypothetical protein